METCCYGSYDIERSLNNTTFMPMYAAYANVIY
jgi:hypothetical protein